MSADLAKTQKELIDELEAARRDIAELKMIDAKHKQTEEALRKSQALLNALLEGVPNQIFVKDTRGRYLVTNTYLEHLLGKPKEKFLGLDDRAILPPETAELLTASDHRVMASGEAHIFEETRTVDGKTEYWRNTKAPYRDHTGEIAGVIGIAEDITERKQTEEALRKSEERFRLAFHTSPDSINFNRLSDGMYLDVNEGFTKITGYTREDVCGVTSVSLNIWKHPEERKRLSEGLRETGGVTDFEAQFVGKDGRVRDGLMSANILEMHGEKVILSITRDITYRKQAEKALRESEERYRRITENAKYMVYRMSLSDGAYEYVSPPSADIFGYTPEEFYQSPGLVREIIPPDWREYWAKQWKRLLQGDMPHSYTYPILHKSGGQRWLFQTNLLIRDESGNPIAIEGIVYDETERKRTQTELVEAKEIAESANLAKSQFLANMSHEIRTPLNGMLGMMQLLHGTPLNETQKEFLKTGLNSGRSLLRILDDILDLSRIESDKMEIREEVFSLEETMSPIQGALMNDAARKSLSVQYRINPALPSMLLGDSIRLRQILFNLVGNAIKFTAQGGVSIRMFPEGLEADSNRFDLCFEVSDTGIGIPKSKLVSIFEPFTQVDGSYTREYGGTGLGLNIVGRLVKLMDGAVHVESEVGEGTTFRVRIPVKTVKDGSSVNTVASIGTPPLKATQSVSKLRILLAEDDLANQLVARHLLKKQGHTVVCVATGREALLALENEGRFDLILMDVQMPEMDGIETTRKIREDSRFNNFPIIALTAHAMDGNKELFLEAGMDSYLSKPIDMKKLEQVIAGVMRK